ncbi:hypothetical protein ACIPPQ_21390 [Sphingopyxis sp. LARHCG72]
MEGPYLTAMVGLAGAAIGGLTSFFTSWLTLRTQLREKIRTAARTRREEVYTDFIKESARLFGDALGHEREDVADLIGLYALVGHMRLMASPNVVMLAERVLEAIVTAYIGPNRTLHQIRDFAQDGGLDPIRQFSEACRQELERYDIR